jgi:trigger factor
MKLNSKPTGNWEHQLDIEVPVEEVEARLDEVARQIQRRVSLPGFRPGRVPLEMVRQHFADRVEQEFLESFVPRIASEAVDRARLDPAIPPVVRHLRFTPGQPLSFEVAVDVRPEIEAKNYRGIPAQRRPHAVEAAAVEKALGDLREESAIFVDLDRGAQRGDVVLLDSVRLDANGRRLAGSRLKGRRIPLGSPDVVPDLENALLGARPDRSAPSRSATRPTTRPRSWRASRPATRCASGKSRRRSCAIWTIPSRERCSGWNRSRSCGRASG